MELKLVAHAQREGARRGDLQVCAGRAVHEDFLIEHVLDIERDIKVPVEAVEQPGIHAVEFRQNQRVGCRRGARGVATQALVLPDDAKARAKVLEQAARDVVTREQAPRKLRRLRNRLGERTGFVARINVGERAEQAPVVEDAILTAEFHTPRALANAQTQGGQAAGTVVWRWKLNSVSATGSNAFGVQPADENPDGNGTLVRFDLRFPGQQWDAAVGLNYNYFRDYEPGTGRYVESDPIGLRGGLSTYGYAGASPTRWVDRFGLLSSGAKQCVCKFMQQCSFDAHCAWTMALANRKAGNWDDPVTRPCENYLYGFAAVSSYGDSPGSVYAGVQLHHYIKYVPFLPTSPPSDEARGAGEDGVMDARGGTDWSKLCPDGLCKNGFE